MIIPKGSTIALTACSNALKPEETGRLERIMEFLKGFDLHVKLSRYIFTRQGPFAAPAREKGEELNLFFQDESVQAIFDISGGDVANLIIPYLNYPEISRNIKPFYGFSDVSVLLNVLADRSGVPAVHYFVGHRNEETFRDSVLNGRDNFFPAPVYFLKGYEISGAVFGGNLRCFCKLAGTPYIPDMEGRILFLESLGGDAGRTASYLAQIRQTGILDKIRGLLIGTFTLMDQGEEEPSVEELIMGLCREYEFPIARTGLAGHNSNAAALPFGRPLTLKDSGRPS